MADENGKPMSGKHNLYHSGFLGTYGCPTCEGASDSSILENTTGIEWPDKKYYDLYSYQTRTNLYNNNILGDATGEMGPFQSKKYITKYRRIGSWYKDEGVFVFPEDPWFIRGGLYSQGTGSGIFHFGDTTAHPHLNRTFRVVLATK